MNQLLVGFIAGFLLAVILQVLIKKLGKKQEKDAHSILFPLKEKIDSYQNLMLEQRERAIKQDEALKQKMDFMLESNSKMRAATDDLYQALRGNSKTQGDWGEAILERVLEESGLSKNIDYTLQGKGLDLRSEADGLLKPDAIINLPDNKHIVIDSKVSLASSWEQDFSGIKKSLMSHVDDLSSKKYQGVEGVFSPDFVVMFIPMESMISYIYQELPEFLNYAKKKNIIVAGPLSLLPILETVASLWRLARQNENSAEIARQAGLLYDRFSLLVEDMAKIKKSIKRLAEDFDVVDKRLHYGKDNLILRAEKVKELGAKTSK